MAQCRQGLGCRPRQGTRGPLSTDVDAKQTETFFSSHYASPNKRKLSALTASGSSLSERPCKRPALHSRSGTPSTWHGKPTSRNSSPRYSLPTMTGSFSSTRPLAFVPPTRNTFASLALPTSTTCAPFTSRPLAWVRVPEIGELVERGGETGDPLRPRVENVATSGIGAPAISQQLNVNTNMRATSAAAAERIADPTVPELELFNVVIGKGQRFRWKMVWDQGVSARSHTVQWTEFADPLPRPPSDEFSNQEALNTVASRPDLFKVSTPINVDPFEALLADHPNPAFVRSVCTGLREGFWPFAHTHPPLPGTTRTVHLKLKMSVTSLLRKSRKSNEPSDIRLRLAPSSYLACTACRFMRSPSQGRINITWLRITAPGSLHSIK